MVAITRALAPSPAPAGPSPKRSSPELDAKARTCRAQLADWVTCPSAKTPEGKAKIEHISDQLDTIKQQIKKSADPSATEAGSGPDASTARTARTDLSGDYRSASSPVGTHIDTYA